MASIPNAGSTQEILETFGDPSFVPHGAIDATLPRLDSKNKIKAIHGASVELMARLDSYSQQLAGELRHSLETLQRSENRIKYQADLLKNDTDTLNGHQARVGQAISQELKAGLSSEALERLTELNTIKQRMQETRIVLQEAQRLDQAKETKDIKEKLAQGDIAGAKTRLAYLENLVEVWKGTLEESSKQSFVASLRKEIDAVAGQSDGYYESIKRTLL